MKCESVVCSTLHLVKVITVMHKLSAACLVYLILWLSQWKLMAAELMVIPLSLSWARHHHVTIIHIYNVHEVKDQDEL